MRCAFVLLAMLSATAVHAADCASPRPLADLRGLPPMVSNAPAEEVRQVLGDQAHDVTINGSYRGAFTAPGRAQRLDVLQDGGPDATNPQGQHVTLAVFEGDKLVAHPSTDAGAFAAGTGDVDGDGMDEVLLRLDNFQMGEGHTQASLLSLVGGKVSIKRVFKDAAVDHCSSGGKAQGMVIAYCAGKPPSFVTAMKPMRCE